MTENKTLDVRGLSCPEPAMLTRQALVEMGGGILIVLSDSETSKNNIERTGRLAGWKVEISQDADQVFHITFTK